MRRKPVRRNPCAGNPCAGQPNARVGPRGEVVENKGQAGTPACAHRNATPHVQKGRHRARGAVAAGGTGAAAGLPALPRHAAVVARDAVAAQAFALTAVLAGRTWQGRAREADGRVVNHAHAQTQGAHSDRGVSPHGRRQKKPIDAQKEHPLCSTL